MKQSGVSEQAVGLPSYGEAAGLVRARAVEIAREVAERAGQPQPSREALALGDALGRVLAAEVVADRDQPPFARSTRDGYAGRAAEWARGGLRVEGLLRAGEAWAGAPVSAGGCVEIMTGAPVPEGLDCVAMVEHVRVEGDGVALEPGRVLKPGENVVARGAEARAGTVLLPAGTRLHAQGIAAAAACGAAQVEVFRRPRVAILSTGDELVGLEERPGEHQIRNSNTHSLAALVRLAGGEPRLSPPVADTAEALEAAIAEAAAECELLLLSGGVSMGKYDLVEPALASLGCRFFFTGARMQPGKPVVFGELQGLPFFGLPGNPVSAMVCFAVFVAPLLAALGGEQGWEPRFVGARMRRAHTGKPGLTRFLPARLRYGIEGSAVETIAWQGSGDLASTARANCFLVVPEEVGVLEAGAWVSVLLA